MSLRSFSSSLSSNACKHLCFQRSFISAIAPNRYLSSVAASKRISVVAPNRFLSSEIAPNSYLLQCRAPHLLQSFKHYGSIDLVPPLSKVFRRARACKLVEKLRKGQTVRREMVAVDYKIEKTKAEDATDILNFMLEDFLYTEPLNEAVGLKREEAEQFFAEIVEAGLSCPVNYVVRNNDGKIVALRWACILRRDDSANDYTFEGTSEFWKVNEIQRLLHTVEEKIWDITPKGINRLLAWLIISVDKSFARRGIASQLLEHRLDEIKEIGCQGLITTASAYNSQQLFNKMGYKELFAVQHADWKDDNGKQIFKCADKTTKASLVLKLF